MFKNIILTLMILVSSFFLGCDKDEDSHEDDPVACDVDGGAPAGGSAAGDEGGSEESPDAGVEEDEGGVEEQVDAGSDDVDEGGSDDVEAGGSEEPVEGGVEESTEEVEGGSEAPESSEG